MQEQAQNGGVTGCIIIPSTNQVYHQSEFKLLI